MVLDPSTHLLDTWQAGSQLPALERGLTLLALTEPGARRDRLEELTIGMRNKRLLELYESLFGKQLIGVSSCPSCAEKVEIEIGTSDLRCLQGATPTIPMNLTSGNYEVCFRLPTSSDLGSAQSSDLSEIRMHLMRRCVVWARRNSATCPVDALPESVCRAISEAMAETEPLAHVEVTASCPTCSSAWQASFDIVVFLWAQLDEWARRLLFDVHTLACRYGWSESEILALSPARRQRYLDLVRA